jgi:PAS domain S-box-containing protein
MLDDAPAMPSQAAQARTPRSTGVEDLERAAARLADALAAAGVISIFEWDVGADRVAAPGLFSRQGGLGPALSRSGGRLADFLDLLAEADRGAAATALTGAAQREGRFAVPLRLALPGLDRRPVLLQGECRHAGAGGAQLLGALVALPADVSPPAAQPAEGWPGAIYQHASVGIAELDPEARRLVTLNDAYCRLTGFSRAELLNELKLYDLTHPEDVPAERRQRERLMAGEIESFRVEKRFRRKDGSYGWAEVSVSLVERAGRLREVRVVQDITERKRTEAALQESEARFRALFEAMPIGLVAVDLADLRFVSANARAAEQLGYTREDFAALTLAEVEAVQSRDELLARAAEVAAEPPGTLFTFERQQRHRDGSLRDVLISNIRVDLDGRRMIYGAWLDVTEQRAATAALRESEARLRATYERAAVGIAELDPATRRFLQVNDTYAAVGGRVPRDYAAGLTLGDITPPEDLAAEEADRQRLLRGEIESYQTEKRFLRPDGSIGWSQVSVSMVREEGGAPKREVRVSQDVTARRVAEQALRESEERLRLALAAGQVGTFDFDLRTAEIRWDARMRDIWAVPPDLTVTEQVFWQGVHPEDRERVAAALSAARASGDIGPHEVEHRVIGLTDGVERHVASRWQLVLEGDRPARIIGTRVDTTAMRQAAEVLARDKAELEKLVESRTAELVRSDAERRALEERVRRSERLDALGQLTGGVAHDFNNLLTAVLGGAEEILDSVPPGHPLREPAETILAGAERGAELTRRLLAFSRQQPLRPQDVDVVAALLNMRGLLRRAAGERVELLLPSPLPGRPAVVARVDPVQLETAVLNLVANARDAMPEGGQVNVSVELRPADGRSGELAAGHYVVVAVSDGGTGMTAEVLARAMEPFFTTKEVGRGTGLGLSMVYGFAQQSGGTAEIDSTPGLGTTVRLLLPAAAGPAEPKAETGAPTLRPGGGERILVVEDDPLVRAQLGIQLESLGYAVESAVDAPSALARLRDGEAHFDLLLTDVVMPGGMGGVQLAAEARRLRPHLAIVLSSGFTGASRGAEHPAEGSAADWPMLRKPYRRSELAAILQAALATA